MSLIKCSECGKDISDKAEQCPNCGVPLRKIKVPVKNSILHWVPLMVSTLIFIVIIILYVVIGIDAYDDDAYIVLNYTLQIIDVISLGSIFYIIPKQRKILFPLSIIMCIFTFLTMIGTGFGGW